MRLIQAERKRFIQEKTVILASGYYFWRLSKVLCLHQSQIR